ncbi:HAD-IA family hydrolase [Sulfitobacter sp. D35]|uniref:HAD-IA family hydrolase n=1 Tax=Sulfitobacter sp. D35 TaxID=3083252 RepID=UPI00296EF704|nr:HAD-IA family hydrolase [Sulfitobacter sp. D35]MDW4500460.1 HAD-IA family hydrolase [Sulfitobacter sp. D35]
MSTSLRLVIFDVDGTLVDSQGDIVAALTHAFGAVGRPAPDRATMLGIVGLSLDVAMARLAPEAPEATRARLVQAYKDAYMDLRSRAGAAHSSPLFPGAREALEALSADENTLLGIATGKSRRGLDKLIEAHGLHRLFVTQQVADFHPSKPHPSMILQAMTEAGVGPKETVMIGDTSYDMDMAAAAGVRGIGVSWGYHPVAALHRAERIVHGFDELADALAGTPAA